MFGSSKRLLSEMPDQFGVDQELGMRNAISAVSTPEMFLQDRLMDPAQMT
jgi:hypothetical protein